LERRPKLADRMHGLGCRDDQCVRQRGEDRVSVVDQGANAEPLTRRGVERCHLVAITVLGEDRHRLALLLGDGADDAVSAGI
jgi:hypothetical protein